MLSDLATNDLIGQIRNIPHLQINLPVDHAKLLREYKQLPSTILQPYRTNSPEQTVKDHLAKNWHGVGLLCPNGDPYTALQESGSRPDPMRESPVADLLPYTMSRIRELGSGSFGTARITAIKPAGCLTWHSHYFEYKQSRAGAPDGIVVHIPIIQPPKFRYSVIDVWKFKTTDYENARPTIYSANYEVGRATLFNSFHMHNVFNDDTYDRVSVMIYLNLQFDNTANLIRDAIQSYDGVRIK